MYRERYDLNKKYIILSRTSVESLLAGECKNAEELLSDSFTSGIDEATTVLAPIDGRIYQYSVVSNNRSRLPAINAFSSTVKENNVFCREDIGIVPSADAAEWLCENAGHPDFQKKFMRNLSFNCGSALTDLEIVEAKPAKEGSSNIVAGYVIRQRKSKIASIEAIVFSAYDYDDFITDFNFYDDTLSVLKEYLVENSEQFSMCSI